MWYCGATVLVMLLQDDTSAEQCSWWSHAENCRGSWCTKHVTTARA